MLNMVCAGVCIYCLFDIRGLQQWRDAWGFSMQGVSINESGKRMVWYIWCTVAAWFYCCAGLVCGNLMQSGWLDSHCDV